MKKILITGTDSYIGTSFERWVAQFPDEYSVDTVDMREDHWREKSFREHDVVFHVAGIAHVDAKPAMESLYYKVNRDLAIETARKAKSDGVRQFIFMSSIIVYGDSSSINKPRIIDRDTIPKPTNFYGNSKLQAEKGIQLLEDNDFKVVILRPPMIYGNGSKGNYPKLAKLARRMPIFPDLDNERSMLHIDNLCEFVRLMIQNEEKGLFFPQNSEYVKTSEMVRLIAEVHGKRVRLTTVFESILGVMGRIVKIINKVFGNLVYEQSISTYKVDYRIRNLKESIKLTELESETINGNIIRDENKREELVSIIMPVYNCQDFIGIALNSVIVQTYQNWEIIIVDDCSTDHTSSIIKDYVAKETRIKYHKLQSNSGAAVARNTAIDIASGRYIAFLDSDDEWVPEKLEKQIAFMELNGYNFTCSSYRKIDEQGNSINKIRKVKRVSDYNGVLHNCPGNSTVIYDSKSLGKFKIPDIKKRNDYVMWLQILKKEKYLYGLIEILGSQRIRRDSISSKKISLIKYHWKVYREIERLSVLKSTYLILFWIFVSALKLR